MVDATTGHPVPCRLYITDAEGTAYFATSADPQGSAVKLDSVRTPRSREQHVTLSAHPFRVELPPGKYTVRLERGHETLPTEQIIDIPGNVAEVAVILQLQRWADANSRGWYSGDTHVHRPRAELPNILLAEDLNVALSLAQWVTKAYSAPVDGNIKTPWPATGDIAIDSKHVIGVRNTEYELFSVRDKSHMLGAFLVLNHQEPLSLTTPPVAPVAAEARRQGALIELEKHTWPWTLMLVPVMQPDLFELTNNHVWRTEFISRDWTLDKKANEWQIETDAQGGWTEWGWIDSGFKTYYGLLNCGFRLRPTGATGYGVHPVPLGYGRVYVQVDGEFTLSRWLEGLNAGRSFVSNGPLLFTRFQGSWDESAALPGASWTAKVPGTARISGTAESAVPLRTIEVIYNGDVIQTLKPINTRTPAGGYVSEFQTEFAVTTSGWWAVRCFEDSPSDRIKFAHTAPCHLTIEQVGLELRPRAVEVRYFIRRMEEELARNKSVLPTEELREYEQALDVYRKLLEQAR